MTHEDLGANKDKGKGMAEDAAISFARNAARLGYSDLPSEVAEATKKDILDTLGATLAGSSAPGGREIVELVTEFGGREESTILAYGGKVPAVSAALANGSMGHALDYDDVHDAAMIHAGVTVVPAAFAAAERLGNVNGKDFITAVTLGIDVVCRMGLANMTGPVGWILTPLYGYFGAAIAAGKVLGLTEQQLIHAMGIAYSQASGNHQCVQDGALTKRVQIGFAAKGGVMAALMAKKGITGAIRSLEGQRGLYTVYHAGNYDPEPLTANLGKSFEVTNLSFKAYPCCRQTHPYVDAALALRREHEINPGEIEAITAFVNREPTDHELCHPLDAKRNPRNVVDAQFSIPYTIASVLLKGKLSIGDFAEPAIRDQAVLALANKVTPCFDPKLARREMTPARVEIRTVSGRYSKYVDTAYGHPRNPMSMSAIIDKFIDCSQHSARPILKGNISRVVEMVSRLEELYDVGKISDLLS